MAAGSILTDTKKVLGIAESFTQFDPDVIMAINTVLAKLTQLGIGPTEGLMIIDDSATWSDLTNDDPRLNGVQTYVCLGVRLIFDPPQTSFALDAIQKQIDEIGWRLNVQRESELFPYVPPTEWSPW